MANPSSIFTSLLIKQGNPMSAWRPPVQKLIIPWNLGPDGQQPGEEEAVLDPGTSVAAGVANRSIQITAATMDRSPRSEVSRQIHGGL